MKSCVSSGSDGSVKKRKTGLMQLDHREALILILASEAYNPDFKQLKRGELPSIISEWLQDMGQRPGPLDASYGERWNARLRLWWHLRKGGHNPATGPVRERKKPVRLSIDFQSDDSVRGKKKLVGKKNNGIVFSQKDALDFLLAIEAGNPGIRGFELEELPAIITHWLHSIKDPPILLDAYYAGKWVACLRFWHQLHTEGRDPFSTQVSRAKKQKPVRIEFPDVTIPPKSPPPGFAFIDLFAGIGGFRIALESLGGKCVFSSEWDNKAKETYARNYGKIPFGDITNFTKTNQNGAVGPEKIPDHTILCGGFPCQPFSLAGQQLGFEDARGTLFFDILTIAKEQKPDVLFLENVKHLIGHKGGKTFSVICNSLYEIGYKVYAKPIRAYDHGVPQNRPRIFIVAFSEAIHFKFPEPNRYAEYKNVGEIFDEPAIRKKYTITDNMWAGHKRRKAGHRNKGNGYGFSLVGRNSEYTSTITSRYWKDGSEVLVEQPGNKNPRMLTPRECARLQGYPDEFLPHEIDKHAYHQFGNSVAVPVISDIAKEIIKSLEDREPARGTLHPFEPVILKG